MQFLRNDTTGYSFACNSDEFPAARLYYWSFPHRAYFSKPVKFEGRAAIVRELSARLSIDPVGERTPDVNLRGRRGN